MKAVFAHFDGKTVHFDEPVTIKPKTQLVVIVFENENDEDKPWYRFALQNMERAYDKDEPSYENVLLKEPNPEYKL